VLTDAAAGEGGDGWPAEARLLAARRLHTRLPSISGEFRVNTPLTRIRSVGGLCADGAVCWLVGSPSVFVMRVGLWTKSMGMFGYAVLGAWPVVLFVHDHCQPTCARLWHC
jgi:hypothetical protein